LTGGDVFIQRAGTAELVLATEGTTLQPGDYIRSAVGATAEVTFFEGSTIELKGDTQISLTDISLSDTGSTTIHLKQIFGDTVSRVKKLTDSASTFEVESQAAVAAVRGSIMEVIVQADGTTIVENIEGDIRATAQGVEVTIPVGYKVTIVPGQAPGQPELIETPTPTPTPTSGPPGPGQPVYAAIVNTSVQADRTSANIGDTITYHYFITNNGGVELFNVTVTDNVAGVATLQSGDTNHDNNFNPGETWIFTASHVLSAADPSPLVDTATFSVTVPISGNTAIIRDHAVVNAQPSGLAVSITSPADGATVTTRTITVTGTVNDPTITSGNITINGETHAIAVSEGSFNTSEDIRNGTNTITVTVANGIGQIASKTVTIHATTPILGIRVELTWTDNDTDVDSHFIRPGGSFGEIPDDCFYENKTPDWGLPGVTTDNATLDQDNTWGYGPENITLQSPYETGTFMYDVHYYSDHGNGPTTATVKIWINDNLVAQFHKLLYDNQVWDCALIDWHTGTGTVTAVNPAIAVTKDASPAEVYAGDNVTDTYHVNNTGNVPLSNITLTDNLTGERQLVSGDTNENHLLDLTEVWVYNAIYTTSVTDIGTLTDNVTAQGIYGVDENIYTAYDTASVTVYAHLAITTESLPDGQVGTSYSQTLTASGGKGSHNWSIVDGSGNLPSGLTLADDGTITGTPGVESDGTYTFTVKVTDDLSDSATQEFTIIINPAITPTPTPT
jgi:uncharacterized repeat protein (TIGR01451 family)